MELKKEYRRIFNSDNVHWSKDIKMNLFFLRATQSRLNDTLKARGHLMLNEAYDVLGFPRTAAGAVIGWVYRQAENYKRIYQLTKGRSGVYALLNKFAKRMNQVHCDKGAKLAKLDMAWCLYEMMYLQNYIQKSEEP